MRLDDTLRNLSRSAAAIEHWEGPAQRTHRASELAADVARLATALRERGFDRRSRVGVAASNSYEWIALDLALIALGALSVVLPEHMATGPIDDQMTRLGLDAVFALRRDRHGWRDAEHPRLVFVDGLRLEASRFSGPGETDRSLPEWRRHREDEYSLVFSSGTSGRTKGMMVRRAGTESTIAAFANRVGVGADDRLFVGLPLSNLQQRLLVYGGLAFGCRIAVVPTDGILRGLRAFSPTFVVAPPVFYETIHEAYVAKIAQRSVALRTLVAKIAASRLAPVHALGRMLLRATRAPIDAALGGRIRVLVTGMAPIRHEVLRFFSLAGYPLLEAYGMTETGVIAANAVADARLGSVGRPLADTRVELQPDGELFVRKAELLTRGYVIHGEDESASVYRDRGTVATGDLGSLDRDGFLTLRGRKGDVIVTASGHKLNPLDLESRIRSIDGVRWVAVVADPRSRPVAVVGIDPAVDASVERRLGSQVLRAARGDRPEEAVDRIVFRRELPSTENGLLTRNLKLARSAVQELVREP